MPLTLKKTAVLIILMFTQTFFSCSKSISETAASKVAGTFKGTVLMVIYGASSHEEYKDFIVKVEHSSNEKVIVSCISTPKAFDNFETVVSISNNTITSNGTQNVNLNYQTTTEQMSLNISGASSAVSFTGQRQ